jgi:hypothetical protein
MLKCGHASSSSSEDDDEDKPKKRRKVSNGRSKVRKVAALSNLNEFLTTTTNTESQMDLYQE